MPNLETLLDQRLLTKYLTKLPGLPSRLGSLRGSRVPAHLKKHKQTYTRPKTGFSASILNSGDFIHRYALKSTLTGSFERTAPLSPGH